MDTGQLNILLNVVTIVFTGGALGVILRHRQGMRGLTNADSADIRDHMTSEMAALRKEVADLRAELHECEEQCRDQVKALQDELWGEKRQRVAEQISLINIILDKVDAPDLQGLRATLERIQMGLNPLG